MLIDRLEIIPLSMPMDEPYSVAYQGFYKAENILVHIEAGGINGWGCAAPDPHVTGETPQIVYETARTVLPDLLKKKDPFRKAMLLKNLRKETPGLCSLWAAVDMALWDLLGKKAVLPVWKILGGYRERIKTSVTVGICDIDETLRKTADLIASGFSIIKVKGGKEVSQDIERLRAIRKDFCEEIHLRFDANQGYTPEEALFFVTQISGLNIELFEQPTPKGRPEQLGIVTRKSETPIMADESLVSLLDAFHLVKKGLVDLMNIKLMKVGGISEAIQVDAVARSAGVEVMVGCMDESAIGIAAGLHFALSRHNIRYADLDGHLGLQNDPAEGTVRISKGYLYPSTLPGFGWKGI